MLPDCDAVEKERVIALAGRLLTALRALQAIAGVSDKEMLEAALGAGARFDGMEADYSRYIAAHGALAPPSSAAEWEALCRRMWDVLQ